MNNPQITEEALERALIRCLRLFAQHGRKLRNRELPDNKYASGKVVPKQESRDARENKASQK